jgi:hypothetical protein
MGAHAVQQLDALGQSGKTGIGERDKHKIHAPTGEGLGEGPAETLAGAGDKNDVLLGG